MKQIGTCSLWIVSVLYPSRGVEYCDECVCVSVCGSAYLYVNISLIELLQFVCMLHVDMFQSSYGNVALRYILAVLWTTTFSLWHRRCNRKYALSDSPEGSTRLLQLDCC